MGYLRLCPFVSPQREAAINTTRWPNSCHGLWFQNETVTIYRSPTDIKILTADDLLPGFSCRVGDIFAGID